MRAHQPGSTPIDIPETVPNPAYTPAPAPAPERAPTKPTKVPEKVPEKVIAPKTGVERSAVRVVYLIDPADCPLRPSDRKLDHRRAWASARCRSARPWWRA